MIITEDKKPKKTEAQWIQIGVDYLVSKEKDKSITGKKYAEQNDINPATFSRALNKYKEKITIAYNALKLKGKKNLTRKEKQLLMINSFRASIKAKIKNDGAAVNNKSEKWFRETLKNGVKGHKVSTPTPGKLYAYVYDAKHKETLPYWDRYPLIVYLGLGKQGSSTLMYGLNLHYIPPKARQQFLEELLKRYASTSTISNKTKLKVDWGKVKGFDGADKMIKAYLPDHIQGSLVEIKPSDWANVVLMPLQQFMSKGKRFSANKVWR